MHLITFPMSLTVAKCISMMIHLVRLDIKLRLCNIPNTNHCCETNELLFHCVIKTIKGDYFYNNIAKALEQK